MWKGNIRSLDQLCRGIHQLVGAHVAERTKIIHAHMLGSHANQAACLPLADAAAPDEDGKENFGKWKSCSFKEGPAGELGELSAARAPRPIPPFVMLVGH